MEIIKVTNKVPMTDTTKKIPHIHSKPKRNTIKWYTHATGTQYLILYVNTFKQNKTPPPHHPPIGRRLHIDYEHPVIQHTPNAEHIHQHTTVSKII
jgi:hypothetical protein